MESKRALVWDDDSAPQFKKKKKATKLVLCFTRRADGVANEPLFSDFLDSLAAGTVSWPNPLRPTQICTRSTAPEDVYCISWWSKDYANLIRVWGDESNAYAQTLRRYKHHFSFTINGPERSVLEPGLQSTVSERLDQLAALCRICIESGQDPNSSIMVHLDPIVLYKISNTAPTLDNLGHVPDLLFALSSNGLSRLHISFAQFEWRTLCARLRGYAAIDRLHLLKPTAEQKLELLQQKVLPFATQYGIKLQTCTATDVMALEPRLIQGACVGWADIHSITAGEIGSQKIQKPKTAADQDRHCTCYPHQDVADKFKMRCTHGCRYCFVRPEEYEW